ncbi:MAG: LysM peptidoglycan-binding domain-containing protein [Candidatus Omnitrophica bacterium]|nr:LysM peptidoglycan-binding domain-containing protein [Candidatus Omnitrophota bacterium]MBD3269602.1 LysM peptidoglycan-binding domain-containing protein [Candidatus Omnitrophota bacterium]
MKKWWFLTGAIVLLAGCMTVRTYTIEKPRTDTEVEGNRGYLSGQPSQEVKESKLGETRKVSVVEIEFGSGGGAEETKEYSFAEPRTLEEESFEAEGVEVEELALPLEAEVPEYEYYTVQKNDTLQKISKKFYGTTRKWIKIFDYNKDVLENPDKLKIGVELKIPDLGN